MLQINRALVSVSDKSNLGLLADGFKKFNVDTVSTGGTAAKLEELGMQVTTVENVTGFPEILGGRVKTLHPKIFGGILARNTQHDIADLKNHEITNFNLVVVNLYPFEEALAKGDKSLDAMLEEIDIGGVALLRASAKNWMRCVTVCDPNDYQLVIEDMVTNGGKVSTALSRKLAVKAFAQTSRYDALISSYLAEESEGQLPLALCHSLHQSFALKYGENPHQHAALYSATNTKAEFSQLQGKELSYNNFIDMDGCLGVLSEFQTGLTCCIVKHTNPCGVGISTSNDPAEAFERALAGDPMSAFGGVVGFTQKIDGKAAEAIKGRFFELVAAPKFSNEAKAVLSAKKNLRLIEIEPSLLSSRHGLEFRATVFGTLVQEKDATLVDVRSMEVVTRAKPTEDDILALQLAWRVCKWVKSNAIVLASRERVTGVGAGQMSRVDSVESAIAKASEASASSVLASDAFFPFRDSIDRAAKAGIRAIVQPGGSIRDEEVIEAANEFGIAMVFSGRRHFRH